MSSNLADKNEYLYGTDAIPLFQEDTLIDRINLLLKKRDAIGSLHFSKQSDTQLRKINDAIDLWTFELSRVGI